MAREFYVTVDDNGLERHIEIFTKREVDKAIRKGLTNAAKEARTIAKTGAPKKTGRGARAISYRTRSRRGFMTANVYIKQDGFYMRFLARGTGERATKRGFGRGRLEAVPFMQKAANFIDPRIHGFIDDAVRKALHSADLS